MNVILVTGDRNWTDKERIRRKFTELGFPKGVGLLVHGGARGADSLSGVVALEMGFPGSRILVFEADWDKHKRAAGPIRNRKQFNETKPNVVLAFHDYPETSKGTKDIVKYAESRGASVWKSWEDPLYKNE